jgi:hypothetical protein
MPDSRSQARWAHSVLENQANGDKSFAKEVVRGMHGRKMASLPDHTKKPSILGRLRKK